MSVLLVKNVGLRCANPTYISDS